MVKNWLLQDYKYKVDIGIWTFIVAGVFSFVVAWATISYQSIKAAKSDPIKSLQYE